LLRHHIRVVKITDMSARRLDAEPGTGIGKVVRALRKQRDWSQAHLAAAAGLSRQSTVSMLETGERKHGTSETIKKVAEAFGMTVDELLRLADAVERSSIDTGFAIDYDTGIDGDATHIVFRRD
jgi:transcriptional regulator with XRE-family HTH domain